jgi:Tol biopolymer transport system component
MRNLLGLALIVFGSLSLFTTGCGQGVQGDRTIHFSGDGTSVSFQNSKDGVFVADPVTGKPRKIFEPEKDIVAASTPLWSPAGKKLIFTTARLAEGEARGVPPSDPNPAGDTFAPRNIIYTCWLRDESEGPDKAANVKLFEAECDHTGYIGANLAVRWHPKGDRILYLEKTAEHRLNLFELNLETKKTRRVFDHDAAALVFDWDPTGAYLAVAIGRLEPVSINFRGPNGKVTGGGVAAIPHEDGLWLLPVDKADWWHVPDSHELARADFFSLLERLRATLPMWTVDGSRFAFATSTGGKNEEPVHHKLRIGDAARREVSVLAESDDPYRDLHWSPEGGRLGLVHGKDSADLVILQTKDKQRTEIRKIDVVRFAGWDHAGTHLAYVVAEPIANDSPWTTLLMPEPGARNAVYLADGDGKQPGKVVFSGLRVTFPKWSPTEEKLSLWLTFTPTHRSIVSKMLGVGMPIGDPAATLDVTNGQVAWMATNAFEKAQIGHYHLIRKEYEQAWNWYTDAEREMKPDEKDKATPLINPRDISFFQYFCLTKLGRDAEAREKLEQVKRLFTPAVNGDAKKPDPNDPIHAIPLLNGLLNQNADTALLLRDLYAAEVFLSLNAAVEGQAFFEKEFTDAPTEEAKISAALALSQIHLLRNQHVDYARLATDVLLPFVLKNWKPKANGDIDWFGQDESGLVSMSVLALAPLTIPDFVKTLPAEEVQKLIPRWLESRASVKHEGPQLGCDLILRAAHDRLGHEKEKKEIADRIDKNPARERLWPPEAEKNPVRAIRDAIAGFGQFVQALRGT